MITLYGIKTSRASRCLWMLEELGVPYENVPTSFSDECKRPEFLAVNPNGRVPALVDGELRMFESLAINLHLARKYGRGTPLELTSLDDESRATMWSIWAMTELEPLLHAMLMNRFVYEPGKRDAAKADAAEAQLAAPLAVLEGELGKHAYLLGDRFSAADLNVACVLSWAKMAKYPFAETPRVKAWLDACVKRPANLRSR